MTEERKKVFIASEVYGRSEIQKVIDAHGGADKCFVHPDGAKVVARHFGAEWALREIRRQMDLCAVNRYQFSVLHLYDFIEKALEQKKDQV